MARATNRLSWLQVQKTKQAGRHADGEGLYLQVDPSGAKRWVFVFQWQGHRKEMGLGPISVVSLSEARDERLGCKASLYNRNIFHVVTREVRQTQCNSTIARFPKPWSGEYLKAAI